MGSSKIKGCGEIRLDLKLIYYPLGNLNYAVNWDGQKYLTKAQPIYKEDEGESKKKKKDIDYWILPLGEEDFFIFDDQPIIKDCPYPNPISIEDAEEWINQKDNIKIEELFIDIKKVLNDCYDFSNEKDVEVATLFILQSWFSDILNGVFYVDIRSQTGGGKTILLELMQGLSRYGVLANDMSFAVIPRIIDKYKCTLFFDEIDMINPNTKEDVFKILRTGYRKGQKYIRSKPRTFEPESFDCYGAKAFNYRSDVVDDLKNRSISINTSKSKDKVLPILSLHKETFLKPVVTKIFFFYMNSLKRLIKIDNELKKSIENVMKEDLVNKVNKVNRLLVNNNYDIYGSTPTRISFLYQMSRFSLTSLTSLVNQEILLTKNNEKEVFDNFFNLFENISGRNIEILSLIIYLCSYIGLEIFQNFKSIMEEKAEFEEYDEEDLKSLLREILVTTFPDCRTHKTLGCKYHFYKDIQVKFSHRVHDLYGYKPNTSSLKKFLRELGFIDRINKKVLKLDDGSTVLCLIYDHSILKHLGLNEQEN